MLGAGWNIGVSEGDMINKPGEACGWDGHRSSEEAGPELGDGILFLTSSALEDRGREVTNWRQPRLHRTFQASLGYRRRQTLSQKLRNL